MTQNRAAHHDADAERAVIASVLLDNHAMNELDDLEEVEFFVPRHRPVWRSVCRLWERGDLIDLTTLRAELLQACDLERAGGDQALHAFTEHVPTVRAAEHYAVIVKRHALVRAMVAAARYITSEASSGIVDVEAFLDDAERSILEVSAERNPTGEPEHIAPVVERVRGILSERQKTGLTGLPTGFAGVDRMLAGLRPGQLVIAAGRPGMGKSAFAQAVALQCVDMGRTAAVFSLEMTPEEWVERMMMARGMVPGSSIRTGDISGAEWDRLNRAAKRIATHKIWLDGTPALTPTQLRRRARRLQSRQGLDLVVVDYLQLMRAAGKHSNREAEVAEVSKALKALAKELHVPVLALAQLNRDVEKSTDKRPALAHLRESGQIEQDADVILLLYRPAYYFPKKHHQESAEVIVAKQRNGPTGTVAVRFRAIYTRFEDGEAGEPDQPSLGGVA